MWLDSLGKPSSKGAARDSCSQLTPCLGTFFGGLGASHVGLVILGFALIPGTFWIRALAALPTLSCRQLFQRGPRCQAAIFHHFTQPQQEAEQLKWRPLEQGQMLSKASNGRGGWHCG